MLLIVSVLSIHQNAIEWMKELDGDYLGFNLTEKYRKCKEIKSPIIESSNLGLHYCVFYTWSKYWKSIDKLWWVKTRNNIYRVITTPYFQIIFLTSLFIDVIFIISQNRDLSYRTNKHWKECPNKGQIKSLLLQASLRNGDKIFRIC